MILVIVWWTMMAAHLTIIVHHTITEITVQTTASPLSLKPVITHAATVLPQIVEGIEPVEVIDG